MKKIKFGKTVNMGGMKGENARVSKCGRYSIERRRMASARNGCWNAISYIVTSRLGVLGHYDYLQDAIDSLN